MPQVCSVFLHGWGFGADFWQPVLDALNWTNTCAPDLGFVGATGNTAEPTLDRLRQAGRPVFAVGHSLGFLWLAGQAALPAGSMLVGVNAFGRFAAAPDFEQGVPVRVLQRMRRGLAADAGTVVDDFRKRCGATTLPVGVTPHTQALQHGLDLLITGDVRQSLRERAGHVHLLGGRQDGLVPPDMTEASVPQGVPLVWQEGGHLLPQTHPAECAAYLETIRQSMEQHSA